MDGLTWFGLGAVTAMLVTYALEARSAWFILGFAGACAPGSVYGFLRGAWPFGAWRRCGAASPSAAGGGRGSAARHGAPRREWPTVERTSRLTLSHSPGYS